MCASPIAVSSDGTASQLITVTINGTNDVPVLGGVHLGAVSEDNGAAGAAALTPMTTDGRGNARTAPSPETLPPPSPSTRNNNYTTSTPAPDGPLMCSHHKHP